MRNKTIPAVLAAALLMTCALGLGIASQNVSPAPAQTTPGMALTPSAGKAGPPGMKQVVEVRLTEYKIEMPLQLSAGPTLFKVTNTGDIFHRFEIEGKGIEMEVESGMDAGQTRTLELDLKPGVYEVYCPVRGHKKAGMSLRVQVT